MSKTQEIVTKNVRKILFALCFIFNFQFSILNCFAQTDTEFWFACPDLSSGHCERPKIQLISYGAAAEVTISQPANPAFTPIVRNLNAYDGSTVDMQNFLSAIETQTGGVKNTGLLIQADVAISAYYANTCDNSEIYALKGRNALGTNFLIPTQYDYPNSGGYSGLCYNKVEIVSAEDSADITIIPTKACVGHAANVPFTIRLNRGQTFALQASSRAAADHLFGTTVTSTKRIAVNYTDDTLEGPGGDLVGDQLVPVDLLGTKYIAVSNNAGRTGLNDKVYVFPVENNTQVFFNGTLNATLNKGGKTSFSITDNTVLITADKPVSVLQYTYNSAEPGASILPALDCTGSREISYSPIGGTPKVTVLARTEDVYEADGTTGAFRINGNAWLMPAQNFIPVAADNSWSYFRGDVNVGAQTMKITNTKNALFHAGFFDNPGTTCSFGYFSNYNTTPLESATDRAYYRVGETITLSLNDADAYTDIVWKKAGGETVGTDAEIQIPNCTQADAGKYVVQGVSVIGCEVEPDTFYVHVFAQAQAENLDICYGNSLTLNAAGAAPFQWSDGSTANSITVNPTAPTDYWVKSYYLGADGLASFLLTDTFHVAVRDSLKPVILGDNFLCNGLATLTVSADYETYLWNTGETTKTISAINAGDYWVKVTDGDCFGTGFFTVNPAPEIDINILNDKISFCPDKTDFEIEYQLIIGEVGSAEIAINGRDAACTVSTTENKLIVENDQLTPGIYVAELTVYDKNCGESKKYPFEIMVNYPSSIIAQRWNDILGVMNGQYNGGYNFTAFQWYKNGVPMQGETRSYIYSKDEFSTADTYSVLLTNSAGKQIFTCGFQPEHLTAASVQTLVKPSQIINLNASGKASFYDITGMLDSVQEITDNQVVAPNRRGIYFLKFNNRITKIIVE